jgi:hypothetical protein
MLSIHQKKEVKYLSETTPVSYWDVYKIYKYCNKDKNLARRCIDFALSHNEDPVFNSSIRRW